MKKFLAVLAIVFLANLGCKKLDDNDGLCACSPVTEPTVALVVKNAAGADMLNPATQGYFTNANIQLYYQENGGALKQLNFYVRPSFSYGSDKFNHYQLHTTEIIKHIAVNNHSFYLKLGSNNPLKLDFELKTNEKYKVIKLLVDNMEAPAETGTVAAYVPNIFYINL